MKTFFLINIALSSFTCLGAARSDDIRVPTYAVTYGDLDLSRTTGEARLYRRIDHAARQVCASLDISQSVLPISMGEAYRSCLRDAVSNAVTNVNNPDFTAYVANRSSPLMRKLASG
jgi:UrcA family protein